MSLLGHCPPDERAKREAMSDGEFWNYVLLGIEPGSEREDYDEYGDPASLDGLIGIAEPCPECGAGGACGYDQEGRPMIHAIPADDEE